MVQTHNPSTSELEIGGSGVQLHRSLWPTLANLITHTHAHTHAHTVTAFIIYWGDSFWGRSLSHSTHWLHTHHLVDLAFPMLVSHLYDTTLSSHINFQSKYNPCKEEGDNHRDGWIFVNGPRLHYFTQSSRIPHSPSEAVHWALDMEQECVLYLWVVYATNTSEITAIAWIHAAR